MAGGPRELQRYAAIFINAMLLGYMGYETLAHLEAYKNWEWGYLLRAVEMAWPVLNVYCFARRAASRLRIFTQVLNFLFLIVGAYGITYVLMTAVYYRLQALLLISTYLAVALFNLLMLGTIRQSGNTASSEDKVQ